MLAACEAGMAEMCGEKRLFRHFESAVVIYFAGRGNQQAEKAGGVLPAFSESAPSKTHCRPAAALTVRFL
jgi:hypothetical protein